MIAHIVGMLMQRFLFMTKYRVCVFDFVKKESELLKEFNEYGNAEEFAYSEALGYCEDEKPRLTKVCDNIKVYLTGCDFGVTIEEY